jgi:hypothetical protein
VLGLKLKTRYDYYYGFDQQQWLETGQVLHGLKNTSGLLVDNPRESMVQDVISHYLKPGMTRVQVLKLLGPADREGVEQQLPDNIQVPGSLLKSMPFNATAYGQWFGKHTQPDTLMRYIVGWSAVDPTSSRVRYGGSGKVRKYWVAVH